MTKKVDIEELKRLYANPGSGFTDGELAERLEVDRTAIYRCRKKLEDDGVSFKETEHGRYRTDSETFVSHIAVSPSQALVLYLATRRLSRNTRLAKQSVQNALEKLALALHKPMLERLVKAASQVVEHPDSRQREELLTTLIRGWTEQIKVHIRYRGLKSAKSTNHTICPYLIEPSPWSDSVYVIAKTNAWDNVTPFHLERIEKASLSTETFTVETSFAEETLFKYTWGIWYSDKKPEQVELRFSGQEAIRRLQESVWHPDQTISEPDNHGRVIWSAPISEWQEMLPWIRGWGAACEVIAPKELRDHMMGETKQMAEIYGWSAHRGMNVTPSLEQTFADFFGD